MSTQMHKSKDGVWRPCTASTRGCPIGGHVTPTQIDEANRGLQRFGMRDKTLKDLDADTLKHIAAKEHEFARAQPYGGSLKGGPELFPPALHSAQELVSQSNPGYSYYDRNAKKLLSVFRDNKISAEIETVGLEKRQTPWETVDNSKVVITFSREDENGVTKTMVLNRDIPKGQEMVSRERLLHNMLNRSVDYDFYLDGGYDDGEDDDAASEFAAWHKTSKKNAAKRIAVGKKDWENLNNFLGPEIYETIKYPIPADASKN